MKLIDSASRPADTALPPVAASPADKQQPSEEGAILHSKTLKKRMVEPASGRGIKIATTMGLEPTIFCSVGRRLIH